MSNALTKPDEIVLFRYGTLLKALELEMQGMTRAGQSAYSIIKKEFKFKGNRARVHEQLREYIFELRHGALIEGT